MDLNYFHFFYHDIKSMPIEFIVFPQNYEYNAKLNYAFWPYQGSEEGKIIKV